MKTMAKLMVALLFVAGWILILGGIGTDDVMAEMQMVHQLNIVMVVTGILMLVLCGSLATRVMNHD